MSGPDQHFDVAIIGGGPGGSATALALRRRGVERVLLLEASAYQEERIGESIPPDTQLLFRELGVQASFAAEPHVPCRGSCSSWGSGEMGYNDFLLNPHGQGWHLDRRRFDEWLAREAQKAGAELWLESKYLGREKRSYGYSLEVARPGGQQQVRARFVVDASGMAHRFAKSQITQKQLHDRLIFASAHFTCPDDHPFTQMTFIEAVPNGWWYAARLPGNRVLVAFATDPELVKAHSLNQFPNWLEHLAQSRHLAPALQFALPLRDQFRLWVAHSHCAKDITGEDWALVGDAASAYDPISSQGIYKALVGGIYLGRAIAEGLEGKGWTALEAYEGLVREGFEGYLRNRNHFYTAENRWPEAPFWKRRRARQTVSI